MAGSGAASGGSINPDPETPVTPWEKVSARAYLRKVKNLLTGLAPTEAEIQSVVSVEADPAAARNALRALIDQWANPQDPNFQQKMIFFFRNTFQQTGFTPTEDFKPQLLENAGFDLGPVGLYGDDAFPKLVQNLEDSFARTALWILSENRPFSEVLTTRQYMMTTALMSLYIQVEMPNDQPFARFGQQGQTGLAWSVDMTGVGTNGDPTDADRVSVEHPIEDVVNPASPNYMVFDDRPPLMAAANFRFGGACNPDAMPGQGRGCCPEIKPEVGYSLLFQRLFGFTPRTPFSGNIDCGEHGSLPYYTAQDLSDWRIVTLTDGASHPEMFDLPALRQATTLGLAMQRVGFYTTPAYLALWNTNDSNQHRVTANQTLLVALGQSVLGSNDIVPVSTVGLDPEHAVANTECYACHTILDPLRNFWATQYDYNDRNDFPAGFRGQTGNPRPTQTGGVLAFGNVNQAANNIGELGALLAMVDDTQSADTPLNRFALSMAQKLCFFADSAGCSEDDPEFRRIVRAFQDDNFNFRTLIRELLSSALVTGAESTLTFSRRNAIVSVSRRDQLCGALSNRLGIPDVCSLAVAFPFQQGFGGGGTGTQTAIQAQRSIFRLAGALPADAFSRGSESPVTSPEPTLFYRAASELVCETVAASVVDQTGSKYQSADLEGALADMVQNVMGYATGDPHYAEALQILHDNYNASLADNRSATDSLRNTFALACQSPTSLSFGI
jgi:hypothetical protein